MGSGNVLAAPLLCDLGLFIYFLKLSGDDSDSQGCYKIFFLVLLNGSVLIIVAFIPSILSELS